VGIPLPTALNIPSLDDTHFVVGFSDYDADDYGRAIIGVVSSGDEIAYGSEYTFNAARAFNISCAALDSTHFVVGFGDTFLGPGRAMIGVITGNAIAFGSEYTFNAAGTHYPSCAALDATRFVVGFKDDGGDDYGIARIGVLPPPAVTTQAVSNIGTTTATGNGNITDTGGEDASAWGTCLAVTANPDTGDTVDAGTGAGGTGAFTTSIDSLSTPAKYHVRAYATNTRGTGYGADVTFVTHVTTSAIVGVLPSASRVLAIDRDASSIIGVLASASKGFIKSASVIIGVVATASRKLAITRKASAITGVKTTVSRILKVTRAASVIVGIVSTASYVRGIIRSAIVQIGVTASASRALALSRTSSAIVGVKASANRVLAAIRKASTKVGIVATASGVLNRIRTAIARIGVVATASKTRGYTRSASVVIGVVASVKFKLSRVLRIITAQGAIYRLKSAGGKIYRLIHKEG